MVPKVEDARDTEISSLSKYLFHIYADSFKTDECVGAGVCEWKYRLPNHTSIFLVEFSAIDKAIEFALSMSHNIIVFFQIH